MSQPGMIVVQSYVMPRPNWPSFTNPSEFAISTMQSPQIMQSSVQAGGKTAAAPSAPKVLARPAGAIPTKVGHGARPLKHSK